MKIKSITRSNLCLGIALASTLGTRPCDAVFLNSEIRLDQPVTLVVVGKEQPTPSPPHDFRFTKVHLFAREKEDSFVETYFFSTKKPDSFGRPPKQIGSRRKGFKKPFSRRR